MADRAALHYSLSSAVAGISAAFLRRHRVALVADGDESSALPPRPLFADEPDTNVMGALSFAIREPVGEPLTAPAHEVEALLSTAGQTRDAGWADDGVWRDDAMLWSAGAYDGDDAPIVALVQRLLDAASRRRVSDVHIEPGAAHVSVRFRLDGQLVEVERHPLAFAPAIATRVKVMAALDIAEARLPQDGRLQFEAQGRSVDVRVATTPIAHGESIVLRILGQADVPLDLDLLGLGAGAVAILKQALARPHGIILITGPTGSGKTTTLYAALSRLRRPEVKILTVEDPVEMLLDGVNQVQVRSEIGLDYPRTLKGFLRQDPDILMVGEIRDGETADIAMRSALTGHLVLSTLHTNTAIGAFTRLKDIGVEPYLTASTVIATAAQRLVRTLCADCATSRPASASEQQLFQRHALTVPVAVPVANGCPACQSRGYRGRQPVMEIIAVDEGLREAIRDGSFEQQPWVAPAQSLTGQALALVADGRTTPEELHRAIGMT